jgi:hypothetical protein
VSVIALLAAFDINFRFARDTSTINPSLCYQRMHTSSRARIILPYLELRGIMGQP